MGNDTTKAQAKITTTTSKQTMTLKKLSKISVIGRGGFGRVWKMESKKNRKHFAMKQMGKGKILHKKSVESVMNELNLLKCLRHPFLINALFAFQDRENLYLVMDLVPGGDLRFHLIKNIKFNEQCTRFFAACVLVALEFLHFNGILHRDIKPENLVFDKRGYLRVTDLGVARIWKPENSCDTSGTPGYMSPEVMCRCNHGVAIDYYAVGVIVFECMLGYRPYTGNSRQEIRDKVLSKQVQIKKKDIPPGWSPEAVDFVNQTIQRKPQNRLGNNGPEEVMNHPWFSDVDWQRVRRCEIPPPYNPVYRPEEYQDQLLGGQDATVPAETLILLRKEAIQNVFKQYEFDGEAVSNPLIENPVYP